MVRHVSEYGLNKIKQWEGCILTAYDDADPAKTIKNLDDVRGTLTIGYGHTNAAGGLKVTPGLTITQEMADGVLIADLKYFEKQVESLVHVPLTDNQFAALVSFQLNTGALEGSTLLRKLNNGDYAAVPDELLRWNKTTIKGKKVVSQGLKNRRAAEIGLWATGQPIMPTVASAPDLVADAPPVISKENVSWGAGILATAASGFDGSGPIQYVLAAIIAISFLVAGYLFFKRRRG